jgi:hypothetical protein
MPCVRITSIHCTNLTKMQWDGGATNTYYQTWVDRFVFNACTKMGYSTSKNTIWIPLWCVGQYKILTLHGVDKA